MNKYISVLLVLVMTYDVCAGESSKAVNQIKNSAMNQAFSYGDSAVESWARDKLSNLRLIEVETKSRADSKPTFRAITLFELTGNEYNKYLSQISYSTFNDRETLNVGLVYRNLNEDMTKMYGINIFYDHEFNHGHTRAGLGFEMKSSVYDININFYEAMSNKHNVKGIPEVAASGYDAEIGVLLPYLPWARLYYKTYQWNNITENIKHGQTFSLYMEPTSRLSVEAGMQDDSTTNSHNAFLKLNYVVCCNEKKMGPRAFTVSKNAYTFRGINHDRVYEKVRRENNIITVSGGDGIIIQASGF